MKNNAYSSNLNTQTYMKNPPTRQTIAAPQAQTISKPNPTGILYYFYSIRSLYYISY